MKTTKTVVLVLALIALSASLRASGLTFSIVNRSSGEARVTYSDGIKSGSVPIEPGFESVFAIEFTRNMSFRSIQTRSYSFDLSPFDAKQFGTLWFVITSEDRIEVFPASRIKELDEEHVEIERQNDPPIVMAGERIKAAEPGATDNPGDAQ